MSENDPYAVERRIAHETKEKFELYLLSLVFTLLGLAIQSASFGPSIVQNTLELCAWLCLLISGIGGLWHLQWNPVLRTHMAARNSREAEISKLQEAQLRGEKSVLIVSSGAQQPIQDRIKNHEDAMAIYDKEIQRLDRRTGIAYDLHWRLFIFGIILAIMSRGFTPGIAVFESIRNLFE